MVKGIYIHIIFLMFFHSVLAQHNAYQGMFYYDALNINPAYTGMKEALTINANSRNQWLKIKGAPSTYNVSAHVLMPSQKHGLGIQIKKDEIGITDNLDMLGTYSYRIKFKNQKFISAGLGFGLNQLMQNKDLISAIDKKDKLFDDLFYRKFNFICDFGIIYKSKNFMSGITIPQLSNIVNKNYYRPVNFLTSYVYHLKKNKAIKPSLLLRYIKNSPLIMDGNITYYETRFSLGLTYRTTNVIAFNFSVDLNSQFSMAYSYEHSINKTSDYFGQTHEFMLNYKFYYQGNVQSPRYF